MQSISHFGNLFAPCTTSARRIASISKARGLPFASSALEPKFDVIWNERWIPLTLNLCLDDYVGCYLNHPESS